MSSLHFFSSIAFFLSSSGVRISFSPAFFMDASSASASCNCYDAKLDFGFFSPRSKFSNLSIVGFSNPFCPISHHALSPLSGLGRTNLLPSSTLFIKVANVLSYEHTEDGTIICVLNCTICSGVSSLA